MKQQFESFWKNSREKLSSTALVATIGATAVAGCSQADYDRFEDDFTEGSFTLVIEEGGRIRENPYVGSSPESDTLINELEEETQVVLGDGVYITENNNGEWYGIPVDALDKTIDDDDGLIWVNEQKAKLLSADEFDQ